MSSDAASDEGARSASAESADGGGAPPHDGGGAEPAGAVEAEEPADDGAEGDAGSLAEDLEGLEDDADWPPEKDIVFREFFRLKHPEDTMDKVSLMACKRQGIEPAELFLPDHAAYRKEVEFVNAGRQREKKCAMVREERARLVVTLFSRATAKFRRMKAVEARVNQVPGKPADAPSSTASPTSPPSQSPARAASGVASSLPPQSPTATAATGGMSPEALKLSPTAASAEINQFVNRQLRQVLGERQEELDRQRLQQVLIAREEQSVRLEQERAATREKDRKAAQAKRSERLARSHLKTEYTFLNNRMSYEGRRQARSEKEAAFDGKKAEIQRAKRHEAEAKMSVARDRWDAVIEGMEAGCRNLQSQIETQLTTHEQRKRDILRAQTKRIEQRRVQRIERLVHQAQVAERQALREEAAAESVKQHAEEIERRCEARERAIRDSALAAAEEKKRKKEALALNRSKLDRIRESRVDEMIETAVQKERYLQRQEEDRRETLEAKKEDKRLRMDNTLGNLTRLEKRNEYQAMMSRVKIELGLQQKIMLDRERKRQAVEREVRKQQCELAKKQVKDEIAKLRMAKVVAAPAGADPSDEKAPTADDHAALLASDASPPASPAPPAAISNTPHAARAGARAAATPQTKPRASPNTTYNTCGSKSTPGGVRHGRRADTAPAHGTPASSASDRFSYLPGSDAKPSKDTTMFVYTNPPVRAMRGR
eukprot:TRINITY_DN19530_c0_g1_i1.p1 TRINITY_DN19530_c0_g1~~TRINITY_DN19530_c0_g1_i1.p1  ORF type:complete len:715 (+),score=273.72 TRINITY_DN19530_c0_g1_i1:45-2189(+)